MANRVFVCAVVVLWLGSMSWLMVDKILPSLHEGEAPIAAGYDQNVPVAWKVYWGDREVGEAASMRSPGVLNTTNIHNHVVLEDVPLLDLVPAMMRRVVGDIGSMKFDARTKLEFDSLDNFAKFESRVAINEISPVLQLTGRVNGEFLELKVRFGEMTYEPKVEYMGKGVVCQHCKARFEACDPASASYPPMESSLSLLARADQLIESANRNTLSTPSRTAG